jgi:hypothetical protein
MARIDTNIFRDLSSTKQNLPTQESLSYDNSFSNMKIMRVKASAPWIDYVCITPTINADIQK